ncbi:MAG: hypothetical protein M1829_001161 [Trizodia sp. TS-e1964]|nr:MAG: hypothetical protein M1829_001161 [Trizodia sp. TS-e1964]
MALVVPAFDGLLLELPLELETVLLEEEVALELKFELELVELLVVDEEVLVGLDGVLEEVFNVEETLEEDEDEEEVPEEDEDVLLVVVVLVDAEDTVDEVEVAEVLAEDEMAVKVWPTALPGIFGT